jgi:hypothetical protein
MGVVVVFWLLKAGWVLELLLLFEELFFSLSSLWVELDEFITRLLIFVLTMGELELKLELLVLKLLFWLALVFV